MKKLRARRRPIFLLATILLACAALHGQDAPVIDTAAPAEASPVETQAAAPGPIHHTWKLGSLDGTLNILIDPDGTWAFSGAFDKKEPGRDFDVTLALKSKLGAVILFTYSGDAANGVQFSKQGRSTVLQDNFASFADDHQTTWKYRLPLSAEGRARIYEKREKKKAQLRKEEEEAKKRHDEKAAAKKREELKQEEQRELAEERAAASHAQGSGGHGTILGDIANTAGSVVSALGNGLGDVLSFL